MPRTDDHVHVRSLSPLVSKTRKSRRVVPTTKANLLLGSRMLSGTKRPNRPIPDPVEQQQRNTLTDCGPERTTRSLDDDPERPSARPLPGDPPTLPNNQERKTMNGYCGPEQTIRSLDNPERPNARSLLGDPPNRLIAIRKASARRSPQRQVASSTQPTTTTY